MYFARRRRRRCRVGATHRPHSACSGLHPPCTWGQSAAWPRSSRSSTSELTTGSLSCPPMPCSLVDACLKNPKKAPLCLTFSQAQDALPGGDRAPHLIPQSGHPIWKAPFRRAKKRRGAREPEKRPAISARVHHLPVSLSCATQRVHSGLLAITQRVRSLWRSRHLKRASPRREVRFSAFRRQWRIASIWSPTKREAGRPRSARRIRSRTLAG
jgi:hypothetical protein